MPKNNRLTALLDKLIVDGDSLLKSAGTNNVIPLPQRESLRRWSNELILFNTLAGEMIKPWANRLIHEGIIITREYIDRPLATLRTIKYAMDNDLLVRYEDLVIAETFADLSEQANYLLSQNYFLAAGVIYRAILEERLRNLCNRHSCIPSKARVTINDYNNALYTASPPVYDKTMMLNITALAAIGNDAAHAVPTLKKEDVERLQIGLTDFLARFSS